MTPLLTIKEAAALLRISPLTLRRHLGNGSIPVHWFFVGGGIRIDGDALQHWIRTADGTTDFRVRPE